MKLNLLPKNIHRLKCLDKSLLRQLNVGALEGLRILLNLIYLTLLFILCYTSLKPFSNQNNKKSSRCMNAINNLSFYLPKIVRNQINIFSSAGPMSGCLSYYFLAELHTLRISQKMNVDALWNLYVTWQFHTVKRTIQISTHNKAQSFG